MVLRDVKRGTQAWQASPEEREIDCVVGDHTVRGVIPRGQWVYLIAPRRRLRGPRRIGSGTVYPTEETAVLRQLELMNRPGPIPYVREIHEGMLRGKS